MEAGERSRKVEKTKAKEQVQWDSVQEYLSKQDCSFGETVLQDGDNNLQCCWTHCKARVEQATMWESGGNEQDRW